MLVYNTYFVFQLCHQLGKCAMWMTVWLLGFKMGLFHQSIWSPLILQSFGAPSPNKSKNNTLLCTTLLSLASKHHSKPHSSVSNTTLTWNGGRRLSEGWRPHQTDFSCSTFSSYSCWDLKNWRFTKKSRIRNEWSQMCEVIFSVFHSIWAAV